MREMLFLRKPFLWRLSFGCAVHDAQNTYGAWFWSFKFSSWFWGAKFRRLTSVKSKASLWLLLSKSALANQTISHAFLYIQCPRHLEMILKVRTERHWDLRDDQMARHDPKHAASWNFTRALWFGLFNFDVRLQDALTVWCSQARE